MPNSTNITNQIEAHLTPEQVTLVHEIASVARGLGQTLYLVGGVVRDLLMEHPVRDIDFVVEGSASLIAYKAVEHLSGEVLAYSQFNTAKIALMNQSVDIATARSEAYRYPGALPTVKPGRILDDLHRRDFTINSMAVRLSPAPFGDLLDPLGGRNDVATQLIRVLHDNSFRDDATRIIRAIRYEQRLGFLLEEQTALLVRRDLPMLNTISGHRLRMELELAIHEPEPPRVLSRLVHLGVLDNLNISMPSRRDLDRGFDRIRREITQLQSLHYLSLLAYHLRPDQAEHFISRLSMPRRWAKAVRDIVTARQAASDLLPSAFPIEVCLTLNRLSLEAVQVAAALEANRVAQKTIERYLEEWRRTRPLLTGRDLVNLGAKEGPEVGSLLNTLLEARLTGKTATKKEELSLIVRSLGNRARPHPHLADRVNRLPMEEPPKN